MFVSKINRERSELEKKIALGALKIIGLQSLVGAPLNC